MDMILFEVNQGVAKISFNRPSSLNALNKETLIELNQILDQINQDDKINIVLFTGVGKAFIAGADIKEMLNMNEAEAKDYSKFGASVFQKINTMNKVTIAAINGFCLGGGQELALACDFRIASDKAKFGQPEVSLGITPGFSATQRLPRIIGVAKAKELLFTGKIINSEMALEIGLVHHVEKADTLQAYIDGFISALYKNSLKAILLTKKAIDEGIEAPLEDGIELETIYFSKCFSNDDQKEGMTAFLEKRKANFNQ